MDFQSIRKPNPKKPGSLALFREDLWNLQKRYEYLIRALGGNARLGTILQLGDDRRVLRVTLGGHSNGELTTEYTFLEDGICHVVGGKLFSDEVMIFDTSWKKAADDLLRKARHGIGEPVRAMRELEELAGLAPIKRKPTRTAKKRPRKR